MRAIPPEIREELEKLERKHAENPEGRYFVPLANALRKAGEFYRAKALLREGLLRYPDYVSAHIVLGRCLQDEGSRGEAEFRFRHVLSLDPQNLVALRTLGEIAAAAGRVEEARSWYRELLSVDPMNEEARLALEELPPEPELEATEETVAVAENDAGGSEAVIEGAAEAGTETAIAESAEEGLAGPPDGAGDGAEVAAEASEQPATASMETAETPAQEGTFGWSPDDLDEEPAEAAVDVSQAEEEEEFTASAPEPESAWAVEEMYLFGAAGTMLDLDSPPPAAPEELYGREDALATETLAELYTRQGFFDRAARVYRELIRRRGSDPGLQEKLARVERLAAGEEDPFADSFAAGFPAESTAGAEGASGSAEGEAPVSIRDYLRRILSWAPPIGASGEPEAEMAAAETPAPGADGGATYAAMDETEPDVGSAAPPVETEAEVGSMAPSAHEPLESSTQKSAWEEPTVELRESSWEGVPSELREEVGTQPVAEADTAVFPGETGKLEESSTEVPPPPPDDDLFPWELPPSSPAAGGSSPGATPNSPDRLAADGPAGSLYDPRGGAGYEPEQAQTPPGAGRSIPSGGSGPDDEPDTPTGGGAPSEPSSSEQEDDDIESFQAWLRSLRR